jgi:hypothetical protein
MYMAGSPLTDLAPDAGAEQFRALLTARRGRARELLSGQRTRLDEVETLVAGQLRRLAEEIDALKADNAELQARLEKADTTGSAAAPGRAAGGRLDWEAEKKRILASLESDFDQHDAEQTGQRLKIEDVLHKTEQVIAEKDRQIDELKRQLEARGSAAATAISAAAAADRQAVDSDALVQEERQRLQQLQEECRAKLRQAEVEISLERAKLARQRAELDEQRNAAAAGGTPPAATPDRTERPASGRWLARLGLSENDREPRRRG